MTEPTSDPPPEWHRVAGLDQLPEGSVVQVVAGGKVLALSRSGGVCGAIADMCPHAGASLGEGYLHNGMIVCPWHGWEFDPVTGRCMRDFEAAKSYAVEERRDGIWVQVPAAPSPSEG